MNVSQAKLQDRVPISGAEVLFDGIGSLAVLRVMVFEILVSVGHRLPVSAGSSIEEALELWRDLFPGFGRQVPRLLLFGLRKGLETRDLLLAERGVLAAGSGRAGPA